MNVIIEDCSTEEGIRIFQLLKEVFNNTVSVEIRGTTFSRKELVLTNETGQEVTFKSGFSAGYGGEGPQGTYRVLKELGFSVNFNFIEQNQNFKLER